MYTETSLFVGNGQQSCDFYRWCNQFSIDNNGFMSVVLLALIDDIKSLPYYLVERNQPLLEALRDAGLTHGVLVTQYQCDDESDIVDDKGWDLGMHSLSDDEGSEVPLYIHDGSANVQVIPSRLCLWTPLESSAGHTHETPYLPGI